MTPVRLALLSGDGIGPEISAATKDVLSCLSDKMKLGLTFESIEIGLASLIATGSTFPEPAFEAARACDGIILGPVSHNDYPVRAQGGLNPSGELRKRLDLYANIRPAKTRADIPPPAGVPFDLVILRENTEGFYADRNMIDGPGEFLITPDTAIAMRKITRHACSRIAEQAFAQAISRRGHVTAVHKANVMRTTCGLFLECCRAVAATHPDITYEEQLVDAMAAHLVRAPDRFDVVVTTNMFGDILSDLASELSGSLGLAPSLNAGTQYAMAQAQHGSAPDIAGKDIANPASLIGSTAMLLRWLGLRDQRKDLGHAAYALDTALEAALSNPDTRTKDLGGPLGTKAFRDAVIAGL